MTSAELINEALTNASERFRPTGSRRVKAARRAVRRLLRTFMGRIYARRPTRFFDLHGQRGE